MRERRESIDCSRHWQTGWPGSEGGKKVAKDFLLIQFNLGGLGLGGEQTARETGG